MTVYVVLENVNGRISALLVLSSAEKAQQAIASYPNWEKRELYYQTAFMPEGIQA